MKKTAKILWLIASMLCLFVIGIVLADRYYLANHVIRLHVRANSDSVSDQQEKLAVRDVILSTLSESMMGIDNADEAKQYLQDSLSNLELCANNYLQSQGSAHQAHIRFDKEAFETRNYTDFSLPAGVYDSLIVEIGSGEGQNWWCVVFPSVCMQDFSTAAASIDMDVGMKNTLTGVDGYEVRFFFLECIGKLENFFKKS